MVSHLARLCGFYVLYHLVCSFWSASGYPISLVSSVWKTYLIPPPREQSCPYGGLATPTRAEEDSWRTATFRQAVVSRIEEAIRQSGMNISKTSTEMENHVYVRAKNRDEYLGYTAMVLLHVREMSKKNAIACGLQQNPGAQQSGPGVGQTEAQEQGNQLQNQLPAGDKNQIEEPANANAE